MGTAMNLQLRICLTTNLNYDLDQAEVGDHRDPEELTGGNLALYFFFLVGILLLLGSDVVALFASAGIRVGRGLELRPRRSWRRTGWSV